jgi:uncharacterized protein (TIGR00730 family)
MSEDRPYICVFCGSSPGARPVFAEATRRVGQAMAARGVGLVYGGGRVGLMGILADAVLQAGGRVVGVIPESLASKEIAHEGADELLVVSGMHERKALMASRAACFLMLPGGIGTFEEFFEVWTWAALGLHGKPIGLLNVAGYFDPLIQLLRHAVAERFVRPNHLGMLFLADDPDTAVEGLLAYQPPAPGPLWIDLSQT